MNGLARRTAVGLLLLCAPAIAGAQYREEPGLDDVSVSGTTAESVILQWPTFSYRLARYMISKYGQPAEWSDVKLVWRDNGPWKKTAVYRVPPGGSVLGEGAGRLEQNVAYRVPEGKRAELLKFDDELGVDDKTGWITVLSNSENENFLAVNLADEIARGKRTAKEAADFKLQLRRLQDAGKSSPYLDRLLFDGKAVVPESRREISPLPAN